MFEAGRTPKIEDLEKAMIEKLGIAEDVKVKLMKYVHYDFEWVEISEKFIDKFLKNKGKQN